MADQGKQLEQCKTLNDVCIAAQERFAELSKDVPKYVFSVMFTIHNGHVSCTALETKPEVSNGGN